MKTALKPQSPRYFRPEANTTAGLRAFQPDSAKSGMSRRVADKNKTVPVKRPLQFPSLGMGPLTQMVNVTSKATTPKPVTLMLPASAKALPVGGSAATKTEADCEFYDNLKHLKGPPIGDHCTLWRHFRDAVTPITSSPEVGADYELFKRATAGIDHLNCTLHRSKYSYAAAMANLAEAIPKDEKQYVNDHPDVRHLHIVSPWNKEGLDVIAAFNARNKLIDFGAFPANVQAVTNWTDTALFNITRGQNNKPPHGRVR